jgi:hypothetical protein
MKPVVAIEHSLKDVAEYLAANGIEVREIKDFGAGEQEFEGCQAIVLSGLDSDFGGYADRLRDIPVISARGRTPQGVLAAVLEKAGRRPEAPDAR